MAFTVNKKAFCVLYWNLPKLSQLWLCNGGFGSCTTQNHLQTKQFVNGTWIPAEWLPVRLWITLYIHDTICIIQFLKSNKLHKTIHTQLLGVTCQHQPQHNYLYWTLSSLYLNRELNHTNILYCLIQTVVLIPILILATQTQRSAPRPQMITSECVLALCVALGAQKMCFYVTFMSKYKCGQSKLERIRHR